MRWLGVFLSARGRIDRKTFWIGVTALGILAAVLNAFGPPARLWAPLLAIPMICLVSKRLHDLGRSGWFSAIPGGLAAAGALIISLTVRARNVPEEVIFSAALAASACAVVGLVFVVRVGLGKPDLDPNVYGALLTAAAEEEPREAA